MEQATQGELGLMASGTAHHHHPTATHSRRRPELTVLHQVVRENYKSFVALVEASGRTLPKHVTAEFEEYLKCGILAHGFLRLKCQDCKAERLIAFSCRGRGFCPSCLGKRQALATEFLIESLLGGLPVRQFVLSFPFELRFLMSRDAKLMGLVLAIVNKSSGLDLDQQKWNAFKDEYLKTLNTEAGLVHNIKDKPKQSYTGLPKRNAFTQRGQTRHSAHHRCRSCHCFD
jgi:hypothetical protein